jgi:hypothetical protein
MMACGASKTATVLPVATSVGTSLGESVSVTIGAAGGVLASPDGGLRLLVPAGALSQDTALTLEPITRTAPGGRGEAWRLGPAGTTFAQAATLRLQLPDFATASLLPALGVGYQDAQGYWRWLDAVTRDTAGQSLSVTTTHLSDWSVLEGVQLSPLAATLKEGQSQALQVVDCVSTKAADDQLGRLLSDCRGALAPLAPITTWSVNGEAGGDGTLGTVHSSANAEAIYAAPGTAPTPNTVAVSATLPDGLGEFAKAVLVSQLTIGTPRSLTGSFSIDASPLSAPGATVHLEARAVTLTLDGDELDETDYKPSGTVEMKTTSFQLGTATCTLKAGEQSKDLTHQSNFRVMKQPKLGARWNYFQQFLYQCPNDPNDWPIIVSFATGSGPACSTWVDVPITVATSPSGTYSSSCGYGPATATWDYAPAP